MDSVNIRCAYIYRGDHTSHSASDSQKRPNITQSDHNIKWQKITHQFAGSQRYQQYFGRSIPSTASSRAPKRNLAQQSVTNTTRRIQERIDDVCAYDSRILALTRPPDVAAICNPHVASPSNTTGGNSTRELGSTTQIGAATPPVLNTAASSSEQGVPIPRIKPKDVGSSRRFRSSFAQVSDSTDDDVQLQRH